MLFHQHLACSPGVRGCPATRNTEVPTFRKGTKSSLCQSDVEFQSRKRPSCPTVRRNTHTKAAFSKILALSQALEDLSQRPGRALLPLAQGFPGGSEGKASAYKADTRVRSLGREDPLEKEMATHSSTHAWKVLWTKKPGRLQSTGSQRVGHD